MGKIVTNAIRKTYKDLIKTVVSDLGESIYLYGAPESILCPNCYWDHLTQKSKGIHNTSFVAPVVIFGNTITPQSFTHGRCPVCKGEGALKNYTPTIVKAIVKWRIRDSDLENTPAGIEGKNLVRVKARKSYYERIRDCKWAVIDGVRCELFQPPVFRGLGKQDELVVAFFTAVEVGNSVKD